MSQQQRPDDANPASDQNLRQDAPEEALDGASSEEQRSAEEQRRHAGAAAAYATAQQSVPKSEQESESEPETVAEPQATQAQPEPQPQPEDAGQQVQQDLDEIAAKAEKADEYLQLAQRTQADFENYRKRAARDAALAQERGVAKLVKELLPAIDNLDRALKAMGEEHSQYAEGIKLVLTDLLGALQRVGVEPFSPDGEQFDPQFHEAVAQQPIEGFEPGMVAEVFQQGYRLGDSVLRPARVLVAG